MAAERLPAISTGEAFETMSEATASPNKTSDAKRAIVIIGSHRSGTSVLAHALSRLGWQLPRTMIPSGPGNAAGHFESLPVMRFNERLLRVFDRNWLDPKPLPAGWFDTETARQAVTAAAIIIEQEFGGAKKLLLKDPRISLLLPLWCKALELAGIVPAVIVACRDPRGVSRSLAARDRLSAAHGLELWRSYMLEAEAGSRGFPRHVVHYEDLLANPGATVERAFEALGLDPAGAGPALNGIIDNTRSPAGAAPAETPVAPHILSLHDAFRRGAVTADAAFFDAARQRWRQDWSEISPGANASHFALSCAETHFGKSEHLMQLADLAGALWHARIAASKEPANLYFQAQLAQAHARSGDHAAAEWAYRGIIGRDSGNAAALHGLGLILLAENRADEAADAFRAAVAADPMNAGLHHALGFACEKSGDLEAARDSYRIATGLDGHTAAYGEALGRLTKPRANEP